MTARPHELPATEVKKHYEFLREWLIQFGHDVQYLTMPAIAVLIVPRDRFAEFVRMYAADNPRGFELGQFEEYGEVRSVEEAAFQAIGWCFGPYGKSGRYLILMREDYTDPHLGAEILHVFEGQLGIRHGTLEKRFKDHWKKYGTC